MAKKSKVVEEGDEIDRITLQDFRSWLSGVEDMQAEGWTPSTEQWKRIREKIDQIDDSLVSKFPTTTGTAPISVERKANAKVFPEAVPPASAFDTRHVVPTANPTMVQIDGVTAKTPNVEGTYDTKKSPFA